MLSPPRNKESSELLCSLSADQIKECISDQDNQYLVSLSNKSPALEHYEVCAAIADILQQRICLKHHGQ